MTLSPPASASYDAIAPLYDDLYNGPHDRAENTWLANRLSAHGLFRFGAYDSLLDIGCGTGLTLSLAEEAAMPLPSAHYNGIDPSYGMLKVARQRHPGYRFRPGSAEISDSFGRFSRVTALFGPYNYASFPRGLQALGRTLSRNAHFALIVYTTSYPKHPKFTRVESPFVHRMKLWTRDQLWNALRLCIPHLRHDLSILPFSSPDFYGINENENLYSHVDAKADDACFLLAVGGTVA